MNIIKTSKDLTPQEIYMLTMNPKTQKMKDVVGQELEIKCWALYEDVAKNTGEVQMILAIATLDGEVFATNSHTFMDDFQSMIDLFNAYQTNVNAIQVVNGTSKAGREFITCIYAR